MSATSGRVQGASAACARDDEALVRGDSARSTRTPLIREQGPLIVGVALYFAARAVASQLTGLPQLEFDASASLTLTGVAVITVWSAVFFICWMAYACFVDRSTGGLLARETWRRFHANHTTPRRLANAGIVIALYLFASDTFVAFKGAISTGLPFRYDDAFAAADRVIHGGHDPWRLLHPLLDSPAVTRAIWINYTYPFFLGIGALVVWAAWTRRTALRQRVLLSMLLMWALLGTLLAALLPAAGPAFYEQVTGGRDFAALMEYLRSVHLTSGLPPVEVQEQLWSEREQGRALHGGISAMPSMHVAMATLFALIGWSLDRRLGAIATIFAAGILVGSVHLGWHYAVDGYVSVLLTILIWIAAGRIGRTSDPFPAAS